MKRKYYPSLLAIALVITLLTQLFTVPAMAAEPTPDTSGTEPAAPAQNEAIFYRVTEDNVLEVYDPNDGIYLRLGEDNLEVYDLSTANRVVENGTDGRVFETTVSLANPAHNGQVPEDIVAAVQATTGFTAEQAHIMLTAQLSPVQQLLGNATQVYCPEVQNLQIQYTDVLNNAAEWGKRAESLKQALSTVEELKTSLPEIINGGKLIISNAESIQVTGNDLDEAYRLYENSKEGVGSLENAHGFLQIAEMALKACLNAIGKTEAMFAFLVLPEGYLPGYGIVVVSDTGEVYAA